jgi:hypothetical protein
MQPLRGLPRPLARRNASAAVSPCSRPRAADRGSVVGAAAPDRSSSGGAALAPRSAHQPQQPQPQPQHRPRGGNIVTPQMLRDVKQLLGSLYEEYDYEVDAAWVRRRCRCVAGGSPRSLQQAREPHDAHGGPRSRPPLNRPPRPSPHRARPTGGGRDPQGVVRHLLPKRPRAAGGRDLLGVRSRSRSLRRRRGGQPAVRLSTSAFRSARWRQGFPVLDGRTPAGRTLDAASAAKAAAAPGVVGVAAAWLLTALQPLAGASHDSARSGQHQWQIEQRPQPPVPHPRAAVSPTLWPGLEREVHAPRFRR